MRNKTLILSLIVIIASIAGLFLSALLILEYFGLAPAAADVVCERGSGVNSCTIVSASPFASIKGVPFIGDVPTAVFGFIFYGFIAITTFMHIFRRNDDENMQLYLLLLILSAIAFAGDIALYLISVFIIKFVCPLCAMTYAATAIILASSILLIKNQSFFGESLIMKIKDYFKKHILTYCIIALILAGAGICTGAGARAIAQAKKISTYEERLQKAIRLYETAKETNILLTEAPVTGKQTAKAKFVMFFDFTCIHCMDEFIVLEKLMKKYPDDMSVSFKFFPLDGSCSMLKNEKNGEEPEACIASAAAFCGHRQGKFMEYAKILFENYHNKDIKFTGKTVRDAARDAGLDIAGFDLCSGSKQAWEFVDREYTETEMLKISSTPTVYLNGKKLTGGARKEDILEGLVEYCKIRNK